MSEDEYSPTDLLKNLQDLFKNYTFKFEGLSDETEKGFKQVVKDLGGNVSHDAKYTLCEVSYFKTDPNIQRNDLYDISYILDSIEENKLLNIENYRYVTEKFNQCENHNALCIVANFAIRSDYCYRLYYKNLLCGLCKKSNKENVSSSEKSVNDLNKMEGIDDAPSGVLKVKNINTLMDEKTKSDLEKNISLSDSLNQTQAEQTNHILQNEIHNIRITDKNNTDSLQSTNNASTSKSLIVPNIKIVSPKNVKKFKKEDVVCISEDEVLEETSSKANNKQSNSGWIDTVTLEKQKVTKKRRINSSDTDSDGLSMDSDDEQKHYNNFKLWWKPIKVSKDQACEFQSCSFEPSPHLKHPLPSRLLSLVEKKIMLKYFISTNSIMNAKGIRVYEQMHEQGYLKHRSTETLRNCFRRTILPDIYSFGLPNDIAKEFRNLDGAQMKGKKKS